MAGSPEVDYQQGTALTAYWSQFFDRESGVLFYQYIAGDACATAADFNLERTHPSVSGDFNLILKGNNIQVCYLATYPLHSSRSIRSKVCLQEILNVINEISYKCAYWK